MQVAALCLISRIPTMLSSAQVADLHELEADIVERTFERREVAAPPSAPS